MILLDPGPPLRPICACGYDRIASLFGKQIFSLEWEKGLFQGSAHAIFTESVHRADSVYKLQCPSVCLSVPLFFFFLFLRLITPIYKGQKSNRLIAKRLLREKLRNYIVSDIMIFTQKWLKILPFFLPLIVDWSRSGSAAASYCA